MIDAWLVVRQEKHVDDKYWVCLLKADALKIARDIVKYWKARYKSRRADMDLEPYGDAVFRVEMEDAFCVSVYPQTVRENGETLPVPEGL